MNVADSGHIGGVLKQEGYELTKDESSADVILLNTCSIRDLAEQKVFSKLGELKERKEQEPNLVVGVCGCMATNLKEGIFKRASHVDLLCGPRSVKHLPRMLSEVFEKGKPQVAIDENEAIEELLPSNRDSSFKAWVNVTQGCDERCTFCVVPNTRGSQASRSPESILSEIRELAQNGYKEVTLLGQTVNAYGLDLSQPTPFSELIRQIHEVDGIEWIRFVTSHPKYVTPDFIEMFAKYPKLCSFLLFLMVPYLFLTANHLGPNLVLLISLYLCWFNLVEETHLEGDGLSSGLWGGAVLLISPFGGALFFGTLGFYLITYKSKVFKEKSLAYFLLGFALISSPLLMRDFWLYKNPFNSFFQFWGSNSESYVSLLSHPPNLANSVLGSGGNPA